ncbi:hypothetical protein SAMN05216324_11039 [Chryseobacterium limigenitum]|uniref:PEP-CTERM protein-sorting domain-containing protein n=1 Tax=Chryseobacterium limigenitum TaxID=1612149 RepID=A0A1K2ISY5_9FLAO|nr:hypothetical protein SAMN05216324_11039 [Chryseobacterium limigenitum]
MLQIALPILFIIFGIFLKKTNNPGFRSSKKFAIMFIILGISTLVARFITLYLKSK